MNTKLKLRSFKTIISKSHRIALLLFLFSVCIFAVVALYYKIEQHRVDPSSVRDRITLNPTFIRHPEMAHHKDSIRNMDKGSSEILQASLELPTREAISIPNEIPSNLILRGIVRSGLVNSFAVFEDIEIQKQYLCKIGDSILGCSIIEILKEKVIIRVDGNDVSIAINRKSGVERMDSGKKDMHFTVSRTLLQESLKNIGQLMSNVSIKPCLLGDGSKGLQLLDIEGGSLPAELGLESGDIIQEINGTPITHPHRLAYLYEGLKLTLPEVTLDNLVCHIGDFLLKIDSHAVGVANETSALYQKLEAGDDVILKLNRKGKNRIVTYRVQ